MQLLVNKTDLSQASQLRSWAEQASSQSTATADKDLVQGPCLVAAVCSDDIEQC